MRVPLLVVPSAPSGEQNAPGCTPACVGLEVGFGFGFFVVGFGATVGFGFGLLVVGLDAGLVVVVAGTASEVGTASGDTVVAAGSAVTGGSEGGVGLELVGSTTTGRACPFDDGLPLNAAMPTGPAMHNVIPAKMARTIPPLGVFFGAGCCG
jgi:hypothetical protein